MPSSTAFVLSGLLVDKTNQKCSKNVDLIKLFILKKRFEPMTNRTPKFSSQVLLILRILAAYLFKLTINHIKEKILHQNNNEM